MTSEGPTVATPSFPHDVNQLAAALASVSLFARMSHEDLLDFASVFKPVVLSAEEVLWRQGDEGGSEQVGEPSVRRQDL